MDIFHVKKEDLNETFLFSTITAWDSLAHMGLISELEDQFDVLLDTQDILHYGSYENGKKILGKYGILFEEKG